jgi:hypothetical protein
LSDGMPRGNGGIGGAFRVGGIGRLVAINSS